MERKENMTIRKVEIERFSVTSSKPFEAVVAAIDKKKSQMISCDLHGVETAAT
jgi:hypothetical protein